MSCRKKEYADIEKYRNTMKKQKTRYRERTGAFKYAPRLWTIEENEKVLNSDKTDRELSLEIKRSISAIQVHRARLKKGE